MTEEERKRVKGLISEHRRFLRELCRIEHEEIDALQKMIDEDTDFVSNTKELSLFPYNYCRLSKEATRELATRCNSEFNNSLFCNTCSTKTADEREKTAEEVLSDYGYGESGIIVLKDESYDSALVGVTDDNRAVYSYSKMVDWYSKKNSCSA